MTKEILKKWLKLIKEYEESASMIIGFFIVVALSVIAFVIMKNFSHLFQVESNHQVKSDVELHENLTIPENSIEENAGNFSVVEKDGVQLHIVESGEGLWQIAELFYGDGNDYIKIYEANKDQMKSPEDIRVGMELKIP